jgi:hypothetical protein
MSLAALKSPEEMQPKPAGTAKVDRKDDGNSNANPAAISDSEFRAAMLAIPARLSAIEQRLTRAESVSQLLNSPTMSQPLQQPTQQNETKTTPFAQLRAALQEQDPRQAKIGVRPAQASAGPRQAAATAVSVGATQPAVTANSQPSSQVTVSQQSAAYDTAQDEQQDVALRGDQGEVDWAPTRSSRLMPQAAVAAAYKQAMAVGGFHTFYETRELKKMRDAACKGEVDFLSRVLDGLVNEFGADDASPLMRMICARILAVAKFDQNRNPGYFAVMAPPEDSFFDQELLQQVDEEVARRDRVLRQVAAGGAGGRRRGRNRGRGGGNGGQQWQTSGQGGQQQQQQGPQSGGGGFRGGGGWGGRGRGGRGGGPQAQGAPVPTGGTNTGSAGGQGPTTT